MDFVKCHELFGVLTKEIPCLLGSGAPTTATEGIVGAFYMDTDTGRVYKCTAAAGGVFTWKDDVGDIETALDNIIAIQESLIGGDGA